MKLPGRKKERVGDLQLQQIADTLAQIVLTNQRKVAGYLERRTQYWDRPSKLIALAFFSALFGAPFFYLLLKAIF